MINRMVKYGSSERIKQGCLFQFEVLGNVKRRLHLRLYKVMAKSTD